MPKKLGNFKTARTKNRAEIIAMKMETRFQIKNKQWSNCMRGKKKKSQKGEPLHMILISLKLYHSTFGLQKKKKKKDPSQPPYEIS